MKKRGWWKGVWRVVRVFVLFFLFVLVMLLGIGAYGRWIEHKAEAFCEAAVQMDSVDEVRALYDNTSGATQWIEVGNTISVRFSAVLLDRYTCSITLDERGKPISQEVVFKD